MARKRRNFHQEGIYLIGSECMLREGYMRRPAVRKIIRGVMEASAARYGHVLERYRVTGDGLRMVLRVKKGCVPPSRMVQYIKSRIAQRCNVMVKRTGPFWRSRFSSTLIKPGIDSTPLL